MNPGRVAGPARTDEQMDALVRDAMRSYARYWLETFRLPKMDRPAVAARVGSQTFGTEHLDAAVQAGRGFILALPHTGNYDVAGLWLIDRYHRPFTTVAERLRPASLFDRFVAYRQSIGMEVLALTGGEQPPTAVLRERLKAGGGGWLGVGRGPAQHRGAGGLVWGGARAGPARGGGRGALLGGAGAGAGGGRAAGRDHRSCASAGRALVHSRRRLGPADHGAGQAVRGPIARSGAHRHPADRKS